MSSASAVEILAIPETVYGNTPTLAGGVTGSIVRKTGESLSGTPTTATSAELRTDRMSGGQVIVGLESGGDINFELSKDAVYDQFIAGAMMNDWVLGASAPAAAITITKLTGAGNEQKADLGIAPANFAGTTRTLVAGDILILSGFTNAANNGPVQVISTTPTKVTVSVPRASTTETSAATGVIKLPDYVDIGTAIKSWSLSKAYTDVLHLATQDAHSQRYTGSLVNRMAMNIAYGEIVTGTFGFLSNGYEQELPSLKQKLVAAGGTVAPAGTSNPLNGSVDMPMVTVGGEPTDFCIQSLSLDMNNNATPQNCIGKIAPNRYNLGTVEISINVSIYLGDQSYDKFMPAKLNMIPISIAFAALNASGGYAFDIRAVQLTFPDPSASGDAPVLIEASGTAKVGNGGASAMRIWRW